tara:strand:- start:68 stop:601 length:534 start_codon:yes stop_codon:yes gene_type:complete
MYIEKKSINSNRLLLEPFKSIYLTDNYVSWLNDEVVVKYSEQRHKIHTKSSCDSYVKLFSKSDDILFAIVIKESKIHIGNLSITIDVNNKRADISILIGQKEYWNYGYGLEAFQTIIDWLFSTGKIRKISAGTMEINIPMLKIMKKSGLTIESTIPRYFLINGKEVGLCIGGIYNSY